MAFPRKLLIPGEQLVLELRPHWIALALPAIATVAATAIAIWFTTLLDSAPWIVWVVWLGVIVAYPLRKLIWWLTSHFVVTSDRVIHREGFIAKYSMEIPLEAINDVRFEQGVFERIVGAGTLVIQSASESGRNTFEDIRHPEEVQRTIYHQGELNQQRMYQGRGPADAPPTQPSQPTQPSRPDRAPGAAPSVTTELERLADLRARGVLTEEEFQAQKAKILGR